MLGIRHDFSSQVLCYVTTVVDALLNLPELPFRTRLSHCQEDCLPDSLQESALLADCLSCKELPPKLSPPSSTSLHPILAHVGE